MTFLMFLTVPIFTKYIKKSIALFLTDEAGPICG